MWKYSVEITCDEVEFFLEKISDLFLSYSIFEIIDKKDLLKIEGLFEEIKKEEIKID